MKYDEIGLAEKEEHDRLTCEGMADHQAVQAWAESLDSENPPPAPSTNEAAQETASS